MEHILWQRKRRYNHNFCHPSIILFLQNSKDWFVYKTFSPVLPQFLQLNTIHWIRHVRNVVGTYCLLRNKRGETYTEKLRQLKHLTNDVIPHSIMTDFYQDIIVILNQEYPLVQHKVCLFHLSKSIHEHVQELGVSMAASGFLIFLIVFPKVYIRI